MCKRQSVGGNTARKSQGFPSTFVMLFMLDAFNQPLLVTNCLIREKTGDYYYYWCHSGTHLFVYIISTFYKLTNALCWSIGKETVGGRSSVMADVCRGRVWQCTGHQCLSVMGGKVLALSWEGVAMHRAPEW